MACYNRKTEGLAQYEQKFLRGVAHQYKQKFLRGVACIILWSVK